MSFRRLTPAVLVAGQIGPEDVIAARDQGVGLIVNNRPDGEEPGQPSSAEVAAWAEAAGLDYAWLPVRGRPTPEQARDMAELMKDGVPTLAFCRSGMRSAALWAMSEARDPVRSHDDIRRAAFEAGYDLSGLPF